MRRELFPEQAEGGMPMDAPGEVKEMFTGKRKGISIPRVFVLTVIVLSAALLFSSSMVSSIVASLPVAARFPATFSFEQITSLPLSEINPASAYCTRVGGSVTMHTRGDGRAYGLCEFTDNRACEIGALFRRECPIGGVRITGFDTTAQAYCAWLGGETLAVSHATCTLPNGRVCDDDALYDGMCDDLAREPSQKEMSDGFSPSSVSSRYGHRGTQSRFLSLLRLEQGLPPHPDFDYRGVAALGGGKDELALFS